MTDFDVKTCDWCHVTDEVHDGERLPHHWVMVDVVEQHPNEAVANPGGLVGRAHLELCPKCGEFLTTSVSYAAQRRLVRARIA